MNRQLIGYVNALSLIVLAQAIALEEKERTIVICRDALQKGEETIKTLMETAFGNVEVYKVGE